MSSEVQNILRVKRKKSHRIISSIGKRFSFYSLVVDAMSAELEDGTWTAWHVFVWLLELTEADNVPRRRFANKNTLMVAVRNIGTPCAVLRVTRVLQIVPVKWHGHCFVLTSSHTYILITSLICTVYNWQSKHN